MSWRSQVTFVGAEIIRQSYAKYRIFLACGAPLPKFFGTCHGNFGRCWNHNFVLPVTHHGGCQIDWNSTVYADVLTTPVIGWINWGENAYRLASGYVVPTANKADLDRHLLSVKKQCQQTGMVWTCTSPVTIKSTMYLWGIYQTSSKSSTMSDHHMAGTSRLEVVPGDNFWQQTDCSAS